MKTIEAITIALMVAVLGGCAAGPSTSGEAKPAPLFSDLGNRHHAISTKNELAQSYFDQGLRLAFAFNHAEAERSFRYAAQLDPECAMCWWGVAFVLGPNINVPMIAAAVAPAYEAVQKARAFAPKAFAAERAYIEAMSARYAEKAPADRGPLDQAFATAAGDVSRHYPDDLDAAALYAEALMDLHPWDFYNKDGTPKRPSTNTIVGTLESVLKRDPDHAWAIHLYIHATEASEKPSRAEPFADKLGAMLPGAGHLVHMPAHTYVRVGRYHDAVTANQRAIAADDSYVAQCHAQGVYPLTYVPHNHNFMWAAAGFAGNSAEALRYATSTETHTAHQLLTAPGVGAFLQNFVVQPMYALVRFGKWQEMLDYPAPAKDLSYPTGIWRYGRGRAFVGLGKLDDAGRELAALTAAAADPELAKVGKVGFNEATELIKVAVEVLAGELAASRGDLPAAIARLEAGVKLEDALNYSEPPEWNYPVRHSLGAVLLQAGKAKQAESVYREDLRLNPENGWSLYGLMQSLEAQGRKDEAKKVKARFDTAWRWADIALTASRI